MKRYRELRSMPQVRRLQEAGHLLERPEELAKELAISVERFSAYDNARDHFYPDTRAKREAAADLTRINDLVLPLEKGGTVRPIDSPSRLTTDDSRLIDAPADVLAFDYVDRELLVQRTTSPARWEDGRLNRGGLRLDILLATQEEPRTPIVAELKLKRDMDPFFALIQALACAAHLATPNQYERMRRHLWRGGFPELSDKPRLDVYLLFFDSSSKGRYMGDLTRAAEQLPARILPLDGAAWIRRIAGLDLSRDNGRLEASVRFAWQRRT
jgi:hypothetical protein